MSTAAHFDVATTNHDSRIGRELPALTTPATPVPQLALPRGSNAASANAWIAAASNAMAAALQSSPATQRLALTPDDTLLALLFERKVADALALRGTNGGTNFTLFPFRAADLGRLGASQEALLDLETYAGSGSNLAVALREVTVEIYRVSSAFNNSVSNGLPSPVNTLRDFLRTGAMNSNYNAASHLFGPTLAATAAAVSNLLARIPKRPLVRVPLTVQLDSFSPGRTRLAGAAGDVFLFDANGSAFVFPPNFIPLPGSQLEVLGFADLPHPTGTTSALEVIEVSLAAIPTATPADRNGNLLPDEWEQRFLVTPGPASAFRDDDGDGYINLQELQAGTDPSDPASKPPGPPIVVSLPVLTPVPALSDASTVAFTFTWPEALADLVVFGLRSGRNLGDSLEDIATSVTHVGDLWTVLIPKENLPTKFFRLTGRAR